MLHQIEATSLGHQKAQNLCATCICMSAAFIGFISQKAVRNLQEQFIFFENDKKILLQGYSGSTKAGKSVELTTLELVGSSEQAALP